MISQAKSQLGCYAFMDLMIKLNQEASKLRFLVLVKCFFVLVVRTSSVLTLPDMEKKEFSCQIRLLLKGDPVWSACHGMETPCPEPVLREHEATLWFFSDNLEISIGGKAWVYFLSIGAFGLVCIH